MHPFVFSPGRASQGQVLVLSDARVPRDPAVLCRTCYLALDPPTEGGEPATVHEYFTDPLL
jgi:hypothetical protein